MIRVTSEAPQPHELRHAETVRSLAPECTLLLKSDGLLPLDKPCPVALFGSGARKTLKGGTGSGDVYARRVISAEQGLLDAGFAIRSGDWLDAYDCLIARTHDAWIEQIRAEAKAAGVHTVLYSLGKTMPEPAYSFPLETDAELAVYVLSRISGEGTDRTVSPGDLLLTETEIRDINRLNAMYPRFLLVLNTAGVIDLRPVAAVRNILLLGQLGAVTGAVLGDLLTGKAYPSGKLATTWAPIGAYPSTEGFGGLCNTEYREDIFVGYRWFLTAGVTPDFPFGFGLGYTGFRIVPAGCSADERTVSVSLKVTNSGKHPGKETLQLYCRKPADGLPMPVSELLAFEKTRELLPGESCTVTLTAPVSALAAFYEEESVMALPAGNYLLSAGNASDNTVPVACLSLDCRAVTERLRPFDFIAAPACAVPAAAWEAPVIPADIPVFALRADRIPCISYAYNGHNPILLPGSGSPEEQLCASLNDTGLARLCAGNYNPADSGKPFSAIGAEGTRVAGSAGETAHLPQFGVLRSAVMADGPAGLRISRAYRYINGKAKPLGGDENQEQFLSPEEKAFLLTLLPPLSEEEKNAPVCLQYCTPLPVGFCLAQAFNPGLAEALGSLAGTEMELFGVDLWLAPAMNLQRNPLCGRNFEYYSEDPLLTGKTAAAIVRGVQKHPGRGAVIKHFACNSQETNRNVSNSILSSRALRELYLRGFEIAVRESDPVGVMTSLNLINGEHACARRDLLTNTLRDEWGFTGLVMTDWFMTNESITHVYQGSSWSCSSAAACIRAGNDVTMPGEANDTADLLRSLDNPDAPYALTRGDLQACALHVLRALNRAGSLIAAENQ